MGGNWLTKGDEVKKFPWYTHKLMHWKRVTWEQHGSYFRLMTIKHAISKIKLATEGVELLYNSVKTEVKTVPVRVGDGVIDELW